jgi:hypothetical protein
MAHCKAARRKFCIVHLEKDARDKLEAQKAILVKIGSDAQETNRKLNLQRA